MSTRAALSKIWVGVPVAQRGLETWHDSRINHYYGRNRKRPPYLLLNVLEVHAVNEVFVFNMPQEKALKRNYFSLMLHSILFQRHTRFKHMRGRRF